MNNIKNTKLRQSNSELTSFPVVEIIHYDVEEKESLKETYPVSYFLDGQCKKLKSSRKLN